MAENYHYPAYSYMEEWLTIDRDARLALGAENAGPINRELACKKLAKFATHYSVIRNFPVEKAGMRLGEAWDELAKIEKPSSSADAKKSVTELAGKLGSNNLASAASKFLWVRFADPIVIYDSVAYQWMKNHARQKLLDSESWDVFYDCWENEFEDRAQNIRRACLELTNVKKFLPPHAVSDTEFEETIQSAWFTRRVFDHFMLSDAKVIQK